MMYIHEGVAHWMGDDELRSIEAIGDPHSAPDYATGGHGSAFNSIDGLGDMVREMKLRPGSTAVGAFPAEASWRVGVDVVIATASNRIHMRGYSCSGTGRGRLEVDNAEFAFMMQGNPGKICKGCASKFDHMTFLQ